MPFADLGLAMNWEPELYADLLSIPGGMRRVQCYASSRGISLTEAQLNAIRDRKRVHYTALARSGAVSLRPGVYRLLEQFNKAGIRQWIVTSSGSASVEALLDSTPDLRTMFQGVVTSDDVEEGKPSPQGYLLCTGSLWPFGGSGRSRSKIQKPDWRPRWQQAFAVC